MKNVTALVLAAGKGTRMKSALPKVLHQIGGKPMIARVLDTVDDLGIEDKVVVVGFGADEVMAYLQDRAKYALQEKQNGTGHAVKSAESAISKDTKTILLLCGDTPLIRKETLESLLNQHEKQGAKATILTAHVDNPYGYGRVIRDEAGYVHRIVEQKDGTPEELAVSEVNTGMYAFETDTLWEALSKINANNAQGELYITDVIGILVAAGHMVSAYTTEDASEILGINSRAQLAEGECVLRKRINKHWMDEGVTMIDPDSVYIDLAVEIGRDTIIYPNTILEQGTVIGEGARIGPNVRISNTIIGAQSEIQYSYIHDAKVASHCVIGPYVHIRPGTILDEGVKVGNFVEVKNSVVGMGTKLPHLSYIGDSDIGKGVNVGCGTITVNFDGRVKSRTTICDDAFVGCNSNLVAPVTIGESAYVGAGTTVTKDVPPKALAVGRAKALVKEDWVREDTFKRK